jgi:hypothetical protein
MVPWASIVPLVGRVTPQRSFSSVLLPAPFCPMTPTVSPRSTSNDTPSSAGNVVWRGRRVIISIRRSAGRL